PAIRRCDASRHILIQHEASLDQSSRGTLDGTNIGVCIPIPSEDRLASIPGRLCHLASLRKWNVRPRHSYHRAKAEPTFLHAPARISAKWSLDHRGTQSRNVVTVTIHGRNQHAVFGSRMDFRRNAFEEPLSETGAVVDCLQSARSLWNAH